MATRAALIQASYIIQIYSVAKADLAGVYTQTYIDTLFDITQDTAQVGWYWNGTEYVEPATPIGELSDDQFNEIIADSSARAVAAVNDAISAETSARNLALAGLQDQIDVLGKTVPVNAQTGTTYTILNTDQGYLVTFSNGSSIAVTLPQATGDFGAGYYFYASNLGAGTVTITPTTSTLGGAASQAIATNEWMLIASDGTNYQMLRGATGGSGVSSYNSRTGAVTPAAADLTGALWTVTDVSSGATTNIGAAATAMVRVTGTTTTTAFDTVAAGIYRHGYFEGALTLTHGAGLLLPGAANITTAAYARFAALSLGSGNWIVLFYQPTNGKAIVAPSWSDITSKPTTISGFGITDAAPIDAKYIVKEATSGLSNEQSLGLLTTGLLLNTVSASVGTLSTATEGTDYYKPGGTDVAVADGGTGASTAASAATNLGVGTGDSPQFTAVNIGHASDTTITRASAGVIAVEGKNAYLAGGTDVALADGGTGASLTDPNADRLWFWDDSAGSIDWLTVGGGLRFSTTTLYVNESFVVAVSDETTAITTGTAKVTFRMPYAFTLTDVRASLTTASSSGIPTVDINESGTTILSTKLTIDANEKTSTSAETAAVISDANLADDAEMTIDIDVAGTGAKGLKVYMMGYRT